MQSKIEGTTETTCLTSFRQHWAEAQIDGPMQTIARYDELAKLLITIGGFLLAVLAAAYSYMGKGSGAAIAPRTKAISVVVFIFMFLFFVCTAAVCLPQPMRLAGKILDLKDDEGLKCDIRVWCYDIEKVIWKKRVLLGLAILFFVISFLVMAFFLLNLLG